MSLVGVSKRKCGLHSQEAGLWEAQQFGQEIVTVIITLEDKVNQSWAYCYLSELHLFSPAKLTLHRLMPALLAAHRQPAHLSWVCMVTRANGQSLYTKSLSWHGIWNFGDHLPVDQKSASNHLFEPN